MTSSLFEKEEKSIKGHLEWGNVHDDLDSLREEGGGKT